MGAIASKIRSLSVGYHLRHQRALLVAEVSLLEQRIETVQELHSDVHQCGGFWYNPQLRPGAASAKQGPCPTLEAVS